MGIVAGTPANVIGATATISATSNEQFTRQRNCAA